MDAEKDRREYILRKNQVRDLPSHAKNSSSFFLRMSTAFSLCRKERRVWKRKSVMNEVPSPLHSVRQRLGYSSQWIPDQYHRVNIGVIEGNLVPTNAAQSFLNRILFLSDRIVL